MPMTSNGQSVLRQMMGTDKSEHKAKQVFYAMVNAGKLKRAHT